MWDLSFGRCSLPHSSLSLRRVLVKITSRVQTQLAILAQVMLGTVSGVVVFWLVTSFFQSWGPKPTCKQQNRLQHHDALKKTVGPGWNLICLMPVPSQRQTDALDIDRDVALTETRRRLDQVHVWQTWRVLAGKSLNLRRQARMTHVRCNI